jgi:hypothetical protein
MANIVTTFPRAVRVIEHTLIPLKDGTTLADRSVSSRLGPLYSSGFLMMRGFVTGARAAL